MIGKDRNASGTFTPNRLVWFLCYMFVDNDAAVVTGREIFGFPKQGARIDMPASPDQGSDITVDALVIERYGVQSRAAVKRFLTVQASGQGRARGETFREADLDARMRDGGQAVEELLHGTGSRSLLDTAGLLLSTFVQPRVPLVFLKQFPDVADGSKACYQAIVEAPAVLGRWHEGGKLSAHQVSILPADSHPVIDELGLAGSSVSSRLAYWLSYDFTMDRGKTIWRAPI